MSFKDIRLRTNYNSATTNILETFYNPVLSEAKQYDRIAGYFDSTSLAVASKGIWNFIKNHGHMRLLCGAQLSNEDVNSILDAEKNLEDVINSNFLNDLNNIDDDIKLNHVKLLGWMIANDYLDIKIGIKVCEGEFTGGILHSKIGILYDENNNYLTFSGSNNETASGWKHNIESFKVFLSWDDSVRFTEDDILTFEEFWENKNSNLNVMDIPEASKKGLIKQAPENEIELNKIIAEISNPHADKRKLFKHQKQAINAWFDNDKKGIFEMATGTGKTFTALNCLKKVLNDSKKNILTVITCPYAHLVEQWADEVDSLNLGKIYRLYGSGNLRWKADLESLLFDLELNIVDNPIILTTHNTFSTDFFIEHIKKSEIKMFLISDEMHHLGAKTFSLGLLPEYEYRLGLSATPRKYMDEEATEFIVNYFGGVVYTFNIREALNNRNPITHETYLTPYNYYPKKIHLTSDEMKEYKDLSRKISRTIFYKKDSESNDSFNILLYKRRAIINNAFEKYELLHKILKEMKNPDHLIIFCSDKQLPNVMQILEDEKVVPKHRFTKDEGTVKSKKYNGLSERQYLIKEFDKGKYKVLVAIKCLNEGVDVPSADKVIIMSSTTNPIEYVQRRGRVLRRYPGKDKAYIYDMIIIPEDDDQSSQGIINNELDRLMDFIENADNKGDCVKKLKKWGVLGEI